MTSATWSNVVAYSSAVLGILYTLYASYISFLLGFAGSYSEDQEFFDIAVLLGLLVFIVSILLIIGIKKRSHKFILPWLCITVVFCAFEIILITAEISLSVLGVSIAVIVITCAMWYPIFRFYRECRDTGKHVPLINN